MYQSKLHANPGKILINGWFGVSISCSWAHLYVLASHSFDWYLHLAVAILRDFVNCTLFPFSLICKYWQNMKIPRLYCHTDSLKCLIVMQSRLLKIMRVNLLSCRLFYTAVMLCYINLRVQKSTAKGICELYEFFNKLRFSCVNHIAVYLLYQSHICVDMNYEDIDNKTTLSILLSYCLLSKW